jgi:hypothetical protein
MSNRSKNIMISMAETAVQELPRGLSFLRNKVPSGPVGGFRDLLGKLGSTLGLGLESIA